MAGPPVHLLLGDELGRAPADRAGAVGGQAPFVLPVGVDHVEILVANEGEVAAGPRDLGVELGLRRRRDPADIAVEPGEIEIAVERNEDRLAVRRPVIADDAAHTREPGSLAPHHLVFGKLGTGAEALAVDQHPRLAGGRVDCPEIVAVPVVRPVAQHGGEAPVRRELEQPGRRPGERGAGEDPLERQRLLRLGGSGRGGGESGGGKREEEAHAASYRVSMQRKGRGKHDGLPAPYFSLRRAQPSALSVSAAARAASR